MWKQSAHDGLNGLRTNSLQLHPECEHADLTASFPLFPTAMTTAALRLSAAAPKEDLRRPGTATIDPGTGGMFGMDGKASSDSRGE
jgi:hypothetical protein